VTSPADHREAATLGPTATPSSGDRSLTVALLHLAPELGALDRNGSLIQYDTRFEPLIGTNWIAEQPDGWMRRLGRRPAARLVERRRPGRPIPVDGIKIGLLICADATSHCRRSACAMLARSCSSQPRRGGRANGRPKGEWEARTLDTGLPMIVCNRTGCDHDTQLFDSESVVVDRGEKLLTLGAPEATAFIVDCRSTHGHIANCELIKAVVLSPSDAEALSRAADWRCPAPRSQTTMGREIRAE
jgi:hypothetical protein